MMSRARPAPGCNRFRGGRVRAGFDPRLPTGETPLASKYARWIAVPSGRDRRTSPACRRALSNGEASAAAAAMLAERSISRTTSRHRPGPPDPSRTAARTGGPSAAPRPTSGPEGSSAGSSGTARDRGAHAEELERPDIDRPRPLAEEQVDQDRHGHRRPRRQECRIDEDQAQGRTSRAEAIRGTAARHAHARDPDPATAPRDRDFSMEGSPRSLVPGDYGTSRTTTIITGAVGPSRNSSE